MRNRITSALPTATKRNLQYLSLSSIALCIIVAYVSLYGTDAFPQAVHLSIPKIVKPPKQSPTDQSGFSGSGDGGQVSLHPITTLIADAERSVKRALNSQAHSVEEAASRYRHRRGRHPPPGFDDWYTYASSTNTLIIEEFWDQIYHDLEPFRGIAPSTLRYQAAAFHPAISIRNGKIFAKGNNTAGRPKLWIAMLETLGQQPHVNLPDIDIPLNINDEPSLIVPLDIIEDILSPVRKFMQKPKDVLTTLPEYKDELPFNYTFVPEWLGPRLTHPASIMGPRPYWELIRPACPPKSIARNKDGKVMIDIWHPKGHTIDAHQAVDIFPTSAPKDSAQGYVRNWTTATNPCNFPYLQGLHGAFVRPQQMSAGTTLFPLFGGSKMVVNNDILLPGADEWNTTTSVVDAHAVDSVAWEERENKLFWRGTDTGGHSTKINWQRMHRYRFLSMLNGTQVSLAEHSPDQGLAPTKTFRLPLRSSNPYKLATLEVGRLGQWVKSWADAAFTSISCEVWRYKPTCPYNAAYFSVDDRNTTVSDYRRHKYTAVVDGNGGDPAGNFTRHLTDGVVVLKASVFRTWYDNRLWPWVHFVPMDNTFIDVYGIMEYFIGTDGYDQPQPPQYPGKRDEAGEENAGHDEIAKKISENAKEWAKKVLRKEDMLVYTYRLLLEYARMMHEERERLGWVGDLLDKEERAKGG